MSGKLFIYDTGDDDNREQAENRFDDGEVTLLPCSTKEELIVGLDRLLAKGCMFNRVLVQTHGKPGRLFFYANDKRKSDEDRKHVICDTFFSSEIRKKGYDALFPIFTTIYFDGCNVGADTDGTEFLQAVGGTLLRRAGGQTWAWTNSGWAIPNAVPWIGAHTFHWPGVIDSNMKVLYFAPGGNQIIPKDSDSFGSHPLGPRFRH